MRGQLVWMNEHDAGTALNAPGSGASGSLRILPLGDQALIIEVADRVSEAAADRVRQLADRLLLAALPGVREVVPTFCSITVHYDPVAVENTAGGPPVLDVLRERLQALLRAVPETGGGPGQLHEVPVCYGGEYGEDLEAVAAAHNMPADAVVEMHCSASYFVGMLGFLPGFPYLGGLDQRLVTPRRATPRTRVARGSVAIGGEHTGIYPLESPGGWHVIGRTPLLPFDRNRNPPCLFQVGDRVRFLPIDAEEFERRAAVAAS